MAVLVGTKTRGFAGGTSDIDKMGPSLVCLYSQQDA
jgi:hypothetical protein